jgi:UTP:GlnB (protein PII) uridylyltransferase
MQRYLAERTQHIASAAPGGVAARQLAQMTDDAVRGLSLAASSLIGHRWAIVALGGWGSGALLPASDLDLLVLTDAKEQHARPFVEAVLYPLWDAGLKVGHQVRTPKQQVAAARDDLKTLTAALTARALSGDIGWAEKVLTDCVIDATRRREVALRRLAARERPGSPWRLEPELKNDAGGRRDFDELTWAAALSTRSLCHGPHALVHDGVLTSDELAALVGAADVLATARWELQRDGWGERLSADAAESLCSVDPEHVQHSLGITALTLERVRARLAGLPEISEKPFSAAEVFELLDRGDEAFSELALGAQAGRLEGLLPGFGELLSVRRPGLGHQLTVGAHCLKTATLVGEAGAASALGRSRDTLDDVRLVQVAALTHDAAKRAGGAGHAERGAGPAADSARAFGLNPEEAASVGELVRHHLLLVETALRADLDDEDAILRCAAQIAHRDLLAPLHVLTAADSLATGPATWSPWTETLVGTLVSRLDTALSEDADGAGLAARGEAVRQAALATTPRGTAQHAFVGSATLRYLAARRPADVLRDADLVASLETCGAAQAAFTAVSAGPVPGTRTVTVAAPDRPELLARLAGAFALAGLDILSVDAYGEPDAVALDSFVVASSTGRAVTSETFSALERFIRAALLDRLELATRLAERRRHYPARADTPSTVDTAPGGWDTIVRVTASDRPGLLHDLALAVAQTGVDIRWAKVQTIDGVARDTFHIVGPDGGPVDDPGVLGHLAMRIRESV